MAKEAVTVDIREKGRGKDGQPIFSERRLFMQLLVFSGCSDLDAAAKALGNWGGRAVLYADAQDPRGLGVLFVTENPTDFPTRIRAFLNQPPFADFSLQPDLTMTGRTYAVGHENNLDEALIDRPQSRLIDASLAWAIWYPVQRTKDFEKLDEAAKLAVLMDHGSIGQSFGRAGLAYDIRLACHGLDRNDGDFVVGILGPELIGPSAVVQAMRKSLQTMEYIAKLGPFFVGWVHSRLGF